MISKPQIIRLAACHTCGAFRGEPCTFTRAEDPWGHRMAARQSHLDRATRARKIFTQTEKIRTNPLDGITLNL